MHGIQFKRTPGSLVENTYLNQGEPLLDTTDKNLYVGVANLSLEKILVGGTGLFGELYSAQSNPPAPPANALNGKVWFNTNTVISDGYIPQSLYFWIVSGGVGAWLRVVSAGPDGPRGSQVLSGTTVPEDATLPPVLDGDWYFRTTTKTLYGPYTSAGWGAGVALVGATGAVGPQGVVGPVGITWYNAWSASTTYAKSSGVSYQGSSYISLNDDVTSIPTTVEDWHLLAKRGDIGATGVTGDVGPDGVQGVVGPSGPMGPVGPMGGGSVLSVGLVAPNIFSVTGSPVTVTGTLNMSLVDQGKSNFLATAIDKISTPSFRTFHNDDLPDTGVLPGTYTHATITVNSKGVITLASSSEGGGGGGGGGSGAVPVMLEVLNGPVSTPSAAVFSLLVAVRDSTMATVTTSAVPITCKILTTTHTLTGTLTKNANLGLASFDDLVLTGPPGTVTILATSPGLQQDTHPIDVTVPPGTAGNKFVWIKAPPGTIHSHEPTREIKVGVADAQGNLITDGSADGIGNGKITLHLKPVPNIYSSNPIGLPLGHPLDLPHLIHPYGFSTLGAGETYNQEATIINGVATWGTKDNNVVLNQEYLTQMALRWWPTLNTGELLGVTEVEEIWSGSKLEIDMGHGASNIGLVSSHIRFDPRLSEGGEISLFTYPPMGGYNSGSPMHHLQKIYGGNPLPGVRVDGIGKLGRALSLEGGYLLQTLGRNTVGNTVSFWINLSDMNGADTGVFEYLDLYAHSQDQPARLQLIIAGSGPAGTSFVGTDTTYLRLTAKLTGETSPLGTPLQEPLDVNIKLHCHTYNPYTGYTETEIGNVTLPNKKNAWIHICLVKTHRIIDLASVYPVPVRQVEQLWIDAELRAEGLLVMRLLNDVSEFSIKTFTTAYPMLDLSVLLDDIREYKNVIFLPPADGSLYATPPGSTGSGVHPSVIYNSGYGTHVS